MKKSEAGVQWFSHDALLFLQNENKACMEGEGENMPIHNIF